jgi:Icc-related predicted phosphoesterase
MKLFFATDLHGSDICFREFLNAREFYGADIMLLGGDLSAGSIIFAQEIEGEWRVHLRGREMIIRNQSELAKLRAALANKGHLLKICDNSGANSSEASEVDWKYEFQSQLARWVELASMKSHHPIYFVPGNDDPLYVDDILEYPFVNIHRKQIALSDDIAILGVGGSTPTPWNTAREYSEEELELFVMSAYDESMSNKKLILLSHCPPYGVGLDLAPALTSDFSYELHLGGARFIPVGSHAIRRAIDKLAPILGLFGHVHEGRRYIKVGQTLCINPGSAFWTGRLQGCIIEINDREVVDFQLTEG